jgi:hypothetical protein
MEITARADYNYNKHLALVAPWDPTDGTALRRRVTSSAADEYLTRSAAED